MSISNKDLKLDWLNKFNEILNAAEVAEKELSYISECASERARKLAGSYYTPIDVARFFWNEYFIHNNIVDADSALDFIKTHKFIEPSVGAGALFFAFLEKLIIMDLSLKQASKIEIDLVDINAHALTFVRKKIRKLERSLNVKFPNITFYCIDFQRLEYSTSIKPLVFFGNPPFVVNKKGTSPWKNLFADFLYKSLEHAGANGAVHYILPMSITFSRDYECLRKKLQEYPRKIALSHFDNIPDTLFMAGKPKHQNTNKANSQRCSILTVIPSKSPTILSTKLHRWSKKERHHILGQSPEYIDVTGYAFNDQIPRPKDERLLHYLETSYNFPSISNFVKKSGKYSLNVAAVARNYIGIRESSSNGVNTLYFNRLRDFYSVLLLVTSDVFQDYWMTIGDGFHVTKTNIYEFPMKESLWNFLSRKNSMVRRIWSNRKNFSKSKINSGVLTISYDFSQTMPSLYPSLVDTAKRN